MRRRELIAFLGGAAAAWPLAAQAQTPQRVARVAFLTPAASESRPAFLGFRARLHELGWVEGRNLTIKFHLAGGAGTERVASLARDITATGIDVVLADGSAATLAMAAASRTIPIVSIMGLDPTTLGLATSIARPGGNVTGMTIFSESLNPKRLELLHELVPSARRIGIVFASSRDAAQRSVLEAGAALGFDMRRLFVDSLAEIARVLAPTALSEVDALVVLADPLLDASPERVVAPINATGKPAIYPDRFYVDVGGVTSYGIKFADAFRRLADQIDRVLRGENPAEMPFERPVRFELVVNLKTAKALGLDVPPSFLARADEVIE